MTWTRVAIFLLIGYLSMGRSFAYLGISPLKVFVGELALGAFLVLRPTSVFGRWGTALVSAQPLSGIAWAFYLFLTFGIFEVLRGIGNGYPVLTTVQGLAFNYYPLFFFLGLWAGMQPSLDLGRLIRWLGWFNGLYGTAYILALSQTGLTMPGFPGVNLFGQPGGSVAVLLGLLCFESRLLSVWPILLLNSFVLLGVQVRGDWLAFGVGFLIWGIATRRIERMLSIVAGGTALLTFAYLIDFSLPAPAGRGGEVSVRATIGRIIAPLNPELAQRYSDTAEAHAGTVSWRTDWWHAIWASVNSDPIRSVVGHGYGFPLSDLVPYLEGNHAVRTPHNVFYYALGYGGWLGVALFFLCQCMLFALLWRTYRLTGQSFGIVYCTATLSGAFFGNFFETPFGAIPYYLIAGLAAAPAVALTTEAVATRLLPVPSRIRRPLPARPGIARRRLAVNGASRRGAYRVAHGAD